ncbi:MAG: hypothetical protein CML19_17925 [Pusillimonas sp.]|nr:hypothetical protein [Pusillimonas sp.]
MASTYVNDLRLEEIGTGEKSGSWGTVTNTNLELIAEAFSYGSEAIADASTHTITVADGSTDEARSFYLKCTGGGQTCTVTLAPNTLSKVWIIENATSYTLTFSQGSSGANVAVSAGQVKMIATDGGGASAGIVYDLLADLSVSGDLFVANTLNVAGDTASGDTAAVGYASADGIIVTGQGSTSDVTLKNDADGSVLTIPTGTTNVDIVGDVTASTINADGDTSADDNAAMGYTSAEGLILTGQGSTNDVTIKNDADADVLVIPTGTTNVDIVGVATAATFEPDGDTSSGDNAAIGYTSAEGLILTGQGSTSDITFKNDADATVFSIPTGTDDILFPDNAKAMFGAGSDFQIYHDSSNTYLKDAGTGGTIFLSNAFSFKNAADDEQVILASEDGAVTLYHNGVAKLGTASTGVDIASSNNTQLTITSTSGIGSIEVGSATSNAAFIDLKTPSSDDFDVRLTSSGDGTGGSLISQAMVINSPSTTGAGIFTATVENQKSDNSTATNGLKVRYSALSPGDSNLMFQCVDSAGTTRFSVANNGTLGGTSDRKLKENIVNSSDKLTDLCKIKIRDFNWKESREKTKQIGWIAQEVQEVFPEMIFEDSGSLAVKHSEFVPILIKSVQEQQTIIEGLLKRIEALES